MRSKPQVQHDFSYWGRAPSSSEGTGPRQTLVPECPVWNLTPAIPSCGTICLASSAPCGIQWHLHPGLSHPLLDSVWPYMHSLCSKATTCPHLQHPWMTTAPSSAITWPPQPPITPHATAQSGPLPILRGPALPLQSRTPV